MSVTVTDPVKSSDKYGQYVSYKVNSNISRTGFASGPHVVVRRYSDFVWLVTELGKEFPGAIIPPLPEKQAVGRFSGEFVETRRRALERFIVRVVAHAELGVSKCLISFLQLDESTFGRAKEETKASKTNMGSNAMAWLEGTVNTMSVGKPELEKSAADLKVEEISQYITQLDKQISNTWKYSEALIKRNREMSQALFEFGQSLSFLGQSEGDAVGSGLAQMGTTIDSISALTSSHAEAETQKFVEPLEDYTRVINSIKHAMNQRQDKKAAYLHAIVDVESKNNALRKLQVAGKDAQAKAKEQSVQNAQEACDAAKAEFEKVTDRLVTEFEMFKIHKAADLRQIIVDFVSLQVDYNKRCEDAWKDLLPKLQAITLEKPPTSIGDESPSTTTDYSSYHGQTSRPQSYHQAATSDFHEQDGEEELAGV